MSSIEKLKRERKREGREKGERREREGGRERERERGREEPKAAMRSCGTSVASFFSSSEKK